MAPRILGSILLLFAACSSPQKENHPVTTQLQFTTIDTDFSKGRLTHKQNIGLADLEKFHGHLCDGLVLGALAMQQATEILFGAAPIDRTDLRIVSQASPCLADVASYLSGGRYQYNNFTIAPNQQPLYILQRISNGNTVSISLKPNIKPAAIDSLGKLAVQQKLSPCVLDKLKRLEDAFTMFLLGSTPTALFNLIVDTTFIWPNSTLVEVVKTDVMNKNVPKCR